MFIPVKMLLAITWKERANVEQINKILQIKVQSYAMKLIIIYILAIINLFISRFPFNSAFILIYAVVIVILKLQLYY